MYGCRKSAIVLCIWDKIGTLTFKRNNKYKNEARPILEMLPWDSYTVFCRTDKHEIRENMRSDKRLRFKFMRRGCSRRRCRRRRRCSEKRQKSSIIRTTFQASSFSCFLGSCACPFDFSFDSFKFQSPLLLTSIFSLFVLPLPHYGFDMCQLCVVKILVPKSFQGKTF
jgi:hypothetical protein